MTTPGPWVVEKAVKYIGHAPIFAIWNDGVEIADVCNSRPEAIVSANAHLIAAAPDLLEACRAAIPLIQEAVENEDGLDGADAERGIKMLRDAIARAEGREGGD